jgi:hypothetical protein
MVSGFVVECLRYTRVWGLGFRVSGFGSCCRMPEVHTCLGFRVYGFGLPEVHTCLVCERLENTLVVYYGLFFFLLRKHFITEKL